MVESFDASIEFYTVREANLRPCPFLLDECTTMRQVPSGERVIVTGQTVGGEFEGSTFWYRVDDGAMVGFIHSNLLSDTPPTETPVPSSTPTNTPVPLAVDSVEQPQQSASSGGSGGNGTCDCSGNNLNCGDFSTQQSAQACYEYCLGVTGTDIHNLDGGQNPNGIACESLP